MLSPDQFPDFNTSDVWTEGYDRETHRLLPVRASDRQPATRGYRVVGGAEMRSYEEKGAIHSLAGQVHAGPYPDPRYPWDSRVDDTHHVLEIDLRPEDGWEAKQGGATYAVNRRNSVPLDRVTRRWDFPDMPTMKRTITEHLKGDE